MYTPKTIIVYVCKWHVLATERNRLPFHAWVWGGPAKCQSLLVSAGDGCMDLTCQTPRSPFMEPQNCTNKEVTFHPNVFRTSEIASDCYEPICGHLSIKQDMLSPRYIYIYASPYHIYRSTMIYSYHPHLLARHIGHATRSNLRLCVGAAGHHQLRQMAWCRVHWQAIIREEGVP